MTDQITIPSVTPEQLQLAYKIEGIFMPEAKRQRIKAGFGDDRHQEPTRFVHYTSAKAALEIIKSKRMWMRNTTCMSDYREVRHGLDIIHRFFADKTKSGPFIAALDACHSGVAQEAVELFNRFGSTIYLSTYITSISEHDNTEDSYGRLSMWRAFGGSTRVGIVFRIPRFSGATIALNVVFSPVAYLEEPAAHGVMTEVVSNIEQNRDFLCSLERNRLLTIVYFMLSAAATCLKHKGFQEEREWRAIYSPRSPIFTPSPLAMESSIEAIGDVPQLIYKLPLDGSVSPVVADLDFSKMFERLIIGPSPYPWVMYGAFVEALTKAGCPEADNRVITSDIPIRTS